MSTFHLMIMTPERLFLDADVEALNITTTDGRLEVLKGHAPITAPLSIGELDVLIDGQWKRAFQSEGFLEANSESVFVFAQACEWPEDIDARRAEEAEHRIKERMRQQKSMMEYQWSKAALARAAERLRITGRKVNLD